ncbi:F4 family fimbrial subunit [Escherichia marmotae]|uniref:Fimbrial protein n=1 Tax=Escherichia marmotae TaxID=1499973 RepID=A0A7W3APE3_9ESCH|nr:hypothetical protein [Escherichia marmotae]MBA7901146.1 hypothetical protein [Escherichia marmotae]QLW51651.1 hypothetical protein HV246_18030 [Escherichia marmotae]
MKKTLIALAVAASAVVSGSAMAAGWEQNGTGGSVNMGGSLTPVENVTPWEVKTGAAVTGLDAQIQKGQKVVDVAVNKAIPVLGIRVVDSAGFEGAAGITPQIDYQGAVDIDGFEDGVTNVYMEVRNTQGEKIGSLLAPFYAGAERSYYAIDGSAKGHRGLHANEAGMAFYGGIDKNSAHNMTEGAVRSRISAIDSEFTAKYNTYDSAFSSASMATDFNRPGYIFNAFYGSGIEQGKTIKITLDQPAGADAIKWKASLPVTVSYQ